MDAWPNGLAAIVIKCMFGHYKLDDATAMVECQSKLMKLRLRLNDNLLDLFLDIADIKAQHKSANYTIDRLTIMLTVLHALPQQYKSVITAVQVAQGNLMTVDDLEDAMDLYHQNVINIAKSMSRNKDGEVALAAFSGACYKCGKVGHTKANCPNKKAVTKGARTSKHKTPRRKCDVCGKEHAGPCWEDKENVHLRPANWKSVKATGNMAMAENNGEFILSGTAIKNWNKLLMPEGLKEHNKVEEEYKCCLNTLVRPVVFKIVENFPSQLPCPKYCET
jgi:hypothetical protein